MRIVCPSCAAAYEVPDARLVAGQSVRCARCGTSWMPLAEPPRAARPELSEPTAAGSLPPPRPVPSDAQIFASANPYPATMDGPNAGFAGGPAVLAGWAVSIAVIVGLGWAAVTFRYDIMHVWPPSERLYSTLGLLAGR